MTFKILSVNYDTDMEQIAAIDVASFASSSDDLEDVLLPPNPTIKTSHQDAIKSTISRLSSDRHSSATKFMKLIDTELAKSPETDPKAIIAYARWKFYTSDKMSEIIYRKREELPAYFGAGCNAEAVMDYAGSVYEARERLYGRKEYARERRPRLVLLIMSKLLITVGCKVNDWFQILQDSAAILDIRDEGQQVC